MTLLLTLMLACGPATAPDAPTAAAAPEAFAGKTCAACGMVVAEQPPPRGQARHRDGTHAHLCSLGDLRAYLQAPSPHGKVHEVWVEALPAGYDPAAPGTAPLPWLDAADAHYVVGFERPGTMGRPALSFASPDQASEAASRVGGRVVDWSALSNAPHDTDPPQR